MTSCSKVLLLACAFSRFLSVPWKIATSRVSVLLGPVSLYLHLLPGSLRQGAWRACVVEARGQKRWQHWVQCFYNQAAWETSCAWFITFPGLKRMRSVFPMSRRVKVDVGTFLSAGCEQVTAGSGAPHAGCSPNRATLMLCKLPTPLSLLFFLSSRFCKISRSVWLRE